MKYVFVTRRFVQTLCFFIRYHWRKQDRVLPIIIDVKVILNMSCVVHRFTC